MFQSQTPGLNLHEADVDYWPELFSHERGLELYLTLVKEINWQQDRVTVYGKQHLAPRLSRWFGEPWMDYSYSNQTMKASPMPLLIKEIQSKVENHSGDCFNSVLANYYRDGADSNGWHSDDEPELGDEPVIASISFGASRDFHLRHKRNKDLKHKMTLENGSLLIMRGTTQQCWQHSIPKRAHASGRINLTFRTIVRTDNK